MTSGRVNQRTRTRLALLRAAAELVREGRPPSIADAAERALVSVATAYRYFPGAEDLWAEAALEAAGFFELSGTDARVRAAGDDVEARLRIVIEEIAWTLLDEEVVARRLSAAGLARWFAAQELPAEERAPVREARRRRWNRLVVEPLRGRLTDAQCDELVAGLNLVWGTEAVVALYDISGLDPDAAKQVQLRTALRVLRGALAEAGVAGAVARQDRRTGPEPRGAGGGRPG